MRNINLNNAAKVKNDEFYTQLEDIEEEVIYYQKHLKGKTIYLNCDDPRESNFFKYFLDNFDNLGLKKLISSCYKNQDYSLFNVSEKKEQAFWLKYSGEKHNSETPTIEAIGVNYFNGNGDFRSEESISLLKESDIVITNPPFSLFREYVAQLIKYNKKFLILGSFNAITYKDFFPLVKDNKVWLGINNGEMIFELPKNSGNNNTYEVDGKTYANFGNIAWWTNLSHPKRSEKLNLQKIYTPSKYPKYDNYDAINVDKVTDIPKDYRGIMGVPITFIDKHNPKQFEIVGMAAGNSRATGFNFEVAYKAHKEDRGGCGVVNGKRKYVRILIKNKELVNKMKNKSNKNLASELPKNSELNNLVKAAMAEKEKTLREGKMLNDFEYKLSDLDMEIIKSVPQGGNWKNIPQKTMNKSKRLLGIQKSGGRTTFYGRLRYDRPSYTLTTYFNRPGSGCHIHPEYDRVLTTREACRLQCFPDNYSFHGNQRDVLKQIGNAVPTNIGYLIGEKIIKYTTARKSLDLFSGAGGLLYGMKMSGIEHVLANDIDRSACITLKVNNPEIEIICDDITNENTKNIVIEFSKDNDVDIICGGPPCQGFSLVGHRKQDDPRNKLVHDFVDIIDTVKPKVFVFENVIGILSYNKGESFRGIRKLFSSIGYNTHAEILDFSNYGVPQRRKRVIIIGVKESVKVDPRFLFPDIVTKDVEEKVTVEEAIGDLADKSSSVCKTSSFISLMKGEISYKAYMKEYELKCFSPMKQLDRKSVV